MAIEYKVLTAGFQTSYAMVVWKLYIQCTKKQLLIFLCCLHYFEYSRVNFKNWIQYRYQRLNCWRRRYYLCGESMSRSIKKKTQVGVEWSLKNVLLWQDWIFIIQNFKIFSVCLYWRIYHSCATCSEQTSWEASWSLTLDAFLSLKWPCLSVQPGIIMHFSWLCFTFE